MTHPRALSSENLAETYQLGTDVEQCRTMSSLIMTVPFGFAHADMTAAITMIRDRWAGFCAVFGITRWVHRRNMVPSRIKVTNFTTYGPHRLVMGMGQSEDSEGTNGASATFAEPRVTERLDCQYYVARNLCEAKKSKILRSDCSMCSCKEIGKEEPNHSK